MERGETLKEKRQHHIGSHGSQRSVGTDKSMHGKFHPFKKRHHKVKGLL